MGDFFKSKKQTPEVAVVADPYKDVREPLNNYLNQNIGKVTPYQGEQVAPMSSQEQKSLGTLDQYTGGADSSTYNAGKAQIEGTLNGKYDPTTSPYYQAVKAEAYRNLGDTQKGIADNAAGGGRYWSGARLQEQGRAGTDVANSLNTVMGDLANKERDRQMQMVPQAMSYGQYAEQAPLRQTEALQTYGALPRTINQATDQAAYEEWIRSNFTQPMQVAQLASGVQQAPVYGQVEYSPSGFSQLMSNPMMQAGLTAAGTALGGPVGGALASSLFGSAAAAGKQGYGATTPSGVTNKGTWSKF